SWSGAQREADFTQYRPISPAAPVTMIGGFIVLHFNGETASRKSSGELIVVYGRPSLMCHRCAQTQIEDDCTTSDCRLEDAMKGNSVVGQRSDGRLLRFRP